MKIKNKLVLVMGYAKSGQSSVCLLQKKGAKVFVYDKNKKVKDALTNAVFVENLTHDFVQKLDLVVLSPGISIYSEGVKLCKLYGKKVIGELELGLSFARGRKILVTGTNGKTTTVNLINQAFNYAKNRNVLVGNVGNPITKYVSLFKTNYIVETSSFQLESSTVRPDVACILNITPNHLDRHFSFEEYKQTKFKIFENMSKNGFLVLNADDEELCKISQSYVKPKIVWFSQQKRVKGAFVSSGNICFDNGKQVVVVASQNDIKLFGKHNEQNVLSMVAICMCCNIKPKFIRQAIMNFKGVDHRLQLVLEKDGVKFVNDSKSTTPKSTLTAVESFQNPIILIVGGSDKGINYDDFALKLPSRVKLTVLTGAISSKLEKSFKKANIQNYVVKKEFYQAVEYASQIAESGDVVLLSPATASFDEFKNFEQRGEVFTKIVTHS